jgi:enamine deaminase RidA (YjgF/YER057c/UK114 family)
LTGQEAFPPLYHLLGQDYNRQPSNLDYEPELPPLVQLAKSRHIDLEANTMSADARFAALKLELPPAPKPAGVYKPVIVVGNMAYVSGHGPLKNDGSLLTGKVGSEVDQQQGYAAAKQTGLAILATLKAHFGTLDKIRRLVKTLGMVNAAPDFAQHPAVINGYSELMKAVFGDDEGVGARSAIGMGSLPSNMSVEIEAIFEVNA